MTTVLKKFLYVFISHKNNLSNVYSRIKQMMDAADNRNYIIVHGGERTL